MNGRLARVIAVLALALSLAAASVPEVRPGVELRFPEDEGSHPRHRLEWWYITGWLEEASSTRAPMGFQVTFFRVRTGLAEDNPSRFAPTQMLFAHAAIADPAYGRLRHGQRTARAGFGLAEAGEGRVDLVLDDWSLVWRDGRYHAVVRGDEFDLALELAPGAAPLLQGEGGYSQKAPDVRAASHYYSLPQLQVRGRVRIEGVERAVRGRAWFDHEWSGDYVADAAVGWDWIGINLHDGGALMAFRMRDAQGGAHWAASTLRAGDGNTQRFTREQVAFTPRRYWRSPRTATSYPVAWQLEVGGVHYSVEPLMDDAELDSRASTGTIYWEGPVRLRDAGGRELGRGYLEMTGYAGALRL